MGFRDSYQQRRASLGAGNGNSSNASNIIGGGKPSGFYVRLLPQSGRARAARKSGCPGSIRY